MKILVIVAHLDDETFGMGGTLIELSKNNTVKVISACKGRNIDIESRTKVFHDLGKKYGYKTEILGYNDLSLHDIPLSELSNILKSKIDSFNPSVVYTTANDLHYEHGIINRCVKVAIRNTSVKKLLEIFIPGSSDFNTFNINSYKQIKIHKKIKSVKKYETEISKKLIQKIKYFHKFMNNSECFRIIFEKD